MDSSVQSGYDANGLDELTGDPSALSDVTSLGGTLPAGTTSIGSSLSAAFSGIPAWVLIGLGVLVIYKAMGR